MLRIHNLTVEFSRYSGWFKKKSFPVVSDLDIEVNTGEIVAVVGSSGAGKSILAHAILGILPENATVSGELFFKNSPLTPQRQKHLRGKEIALIPQSVAFLNPLVRNGQQVKRAAKLSGKGSRQASELVDRSFKRYQLADSVKKQYPFQISGGMARRVLTAMATVSKADLIIADEPTTGLDSATVKESLNYLRQLADNGKAILLITHDLNAALTITDKVTVFYGGTTLEVAKASDFNGSRSLRHPYTRSLWQSLPQHEFTYLSGTQPLNGDLPQGCLFEPRCNQKSDLCAKNRPGLREVNGGWVRCNNA